MRPDGSRKSNAVWHARHEMPKNASLPVRVAWHLAHTDHCGCRPMPDSVTRAIDGQPLRICGRGHRSLPGGPCPMCWPGHYRKA